MENELLAKSGDLPVTLRDHLQQVADYVRAVVETYQEHWELLLGVETAEKIRNALLIAALTHDLGKASEGFQRALKERRVNWEFRHEVLSAALLISTNPDDEALEWAATAVLTHHRDLNDVQLENDCGLVPLPTQDMVRKAHEKFRLKAGELQENWQWLQSFWQGHPLLKDLVFPVGSEEISPPTGFLEKQKKAVEELSCLTEQKSLTLLLTRGWLMASDHAASAGVGKFLSELPDPRFPPLRSFQRRIGAHKGSLFLEAPTGSGKTNAAITWTLNNRRSGERIFYVLPYQASIEAMADTLEEFFGRENVAVLHARALDYAFKQYFEESGEYEEAVTQAKAETELNRLAHKPIKVATPFQLLKWFFGIPRFEIGISEMIGGLFIFDEIHAYDAHVIALISEMVRVLKQLGGRFLFMSATFPPFLKELLMQAMDGNATDFRLDECVADSWTRKFLNQVRHILRLHNKRLEDMLPEVIEAVQEGKRVLIVANRVTQAQEIYRLLKDRFNGIHLLHSRFTRRDRVAKEKEIIDTLKGKRNDVVVKALVATQVVEVSLDVSFDTIFTEIAPVDDLLQRFGRVNRYGERLEGVEVHIACEFDHERLKYVYDTERLSRTLETAPQDGTPLTVEKAVEWVRKVYFGGWTKKEQHRYEQAKSAFQSVISSLKPLQRFSEGEDEFYGLFQSIEVLPGRLYSEYNTYTQEKRYLLANQLLVPIPLGTFHMLRSKGLITRQNRIPIATVNYSDELGLLPREVDVDMSFM